MINYLDSLNEIQKYVSEEPSFLTATPPTREKEPIEYQLERIEDYIKDQNIMLEAILDILRNFTNDTETIKNRIQEMENKVIPSQAEIDNYNAEMVSRTTAIECSVDEFNERLDKLQELMRMSSLDTLQAAKIGLDGKLQVKVAPGVYKSSRESLF